ncbi:MAG TPA: hypothetical protein VMO88_17000, partial [Acidimicrobiales bacterium]|nr:hypothetical protein [Acidimicrobiales bacterium]
MLLLVTVALVFAGLVLLIVGFVQDSLSLIYLSIACAAVAGIALIVFSRLSRRRAVRLALDGVPAAAAPPSPLLNRPRMADDAADRRLRPAARQQAPVYDDAEQRAPQPATARAVFPGEFADEDDVTERQPAMRPAPQMEREPQPQFASGPSEASAGHWEEEADWEEDWGDEVVFPIEDYDDLRVAEILPLLPQLEPDELEDVRDREHNTKARATIIARIDELLGAGPEAPAQAPAPARSPAARKATGGTTKTSGGKSVGGRTVAGKTVGGKVAGGRGAAAGAAAKRAAMTGKAAASSRRTATSPNRSASSNSAAPARSARSAGAPARAGSSSASATRSGAPQKASGTAGKAAAAGKAASAGKSAAGRGAPAPAPARAAAAGKATAAKKAAQSATKAASNKATQ